MQQCFPFLGDLLIKCGYFLFFKLTMQTIAYKGLIFYYLNKSFVKTWPLLSFCFFSYFFYFCRWSLSSVSLCLCLLFFTCIFYFDVMGTFSFSVSLFPPSLHPMFFLFSSLSLPPPLVFFHFFVSTHCFCLFFLFLFSYFHVSFSAIWFSFFYFFFLSSSTSFHLLCF